MKITVSDGTQMEPENTMQHYVTPTTKYPCTYKYHASGFQYAWVTWLSGAPAAWVGQANWVHISVLKST